MKQTGILHIQVRQILPKRREVLMQVIGNAFAAAPPFMPLPHIVDKGGERLSFRFPSILPGPWFDSTGQVDLVEDGLKTRVTLSMNLTGLLVATYLLHWVPLFAIWLIESLWIGLFADEAVNSLVQGWLAVLLIGWPLGVFWLLRRRLLRRVGTYLHNLVFHV